MSPPPAYTSLSASTDSTSRSASTATTLKTTTGALFKPEPFIFFSLLSMLSWILMGVMAYGTAITSENAGGLSALFGFLIVAMVISTPVACASAPCGWISNLAHTGITVMVVIGLTVMVVIGLTVMVVIGLTVMVVIGLTVICMLPRPALDNPFEVLFIIDGMAYGGILLERLAGMTGRFFCSLARLHGRRSTP